MGLHVALIRYQGISHLKRTHEGEPTAEEISGEGGKPFIPYHALKDLSSMYLALGVLVTLALLFEAHIGDPADLARDARGDQAGVAFPAGLSAAQIRSGNGWCANPTAFPPPAARPARHR